MAECEHCGGTGAICNICGENSDDCICDDPEFLDCQECQGEGDDGEDEE